MAAYIVGLVSGFSLGWLASMRYQHNRRHRRRGGYVKPPASSNTSPVDAGGYSILPTPVDFSSWTQLGDQSAARVRRERQPWPNSVTVPISSGNGTVGRGGNGRTQAECADFAEGSALLRRNRGDDAA